jgi:hypothetical protein
LTTLTDKISLNRQTLNSASIRNIVLVTHLTHALNQKSSDVPYQRHNLDILCQSDIPQRLYRQIY